MHAIGLCLLLARGSPIGGALLGKSEDDEVVIETPGGKRTLVIVEVQYV